MWLLRVVMPSVGQWMMLKIPAPSLYYALAAGMPQALAIGTFYGLTLRGAGLC
jgi:hypothetical protein